MKVKIIKKSYDEFLKIKPKVNNKIIKPNFFWRFLLKLVSLPDLLSVGFKCEKIGMEKLGKKEPCLFLMNHSSFIDLEIATSIIYPRAVNIVCTADGFIGKNWLMRQIGCIPTKKFVNDPNLVRTMHTILNKKKNSVLMYPEAGYTLDGTKTTIPFVLAKCIKFLNVPVVMITSYGAFHRQPLYNELRKRKLKVSAKMEYVLSKEDILKLSDEEIYDVLIKCFSFDNFKWQQDNKIEIKDKQRAQGLNRILYKCPHCLKEGVMESYDDSIVCGNCKNEYKLDEYGYLKAEAGKFYHIPDWCNWERKCVLEEVKNGTYSIETDCDIYAMIDTYAIYNIGTGKLVHNKEGFLLTGCNGKLSYSQSPTNSYSINSDFYWYQIADTVCIGDNKIQYYCFPKEKDVVLKIRYACEEMYKLNNNK